MDLKSRFECFLDTSFVQHPVVEPSVNGSGAQVVFKVREILGNKDNEVWSIRYRAENTATAILYLLHESLNRTNQIVSVSGMMRKVFDFHACTVN